ncbi:phage tail protein domain-containing protein [Streptomyces sp. BvitLS-983]|nr:phage tail protein domain-containing protein [Streptomyces sp. BvitLS-983]
MSARGSVDGLESSAPLAAMLPAVFADDDLAQRFVAGLDEVLAPILNTLDCLDSYFDPALTPADFARWLGTWIGAETDGTEPDPRLRAIVAATARLHRIRGTRQGLAETVHLAFGATPEITESGGAAWSARPLGPFPVLPGRRCTSRSGCPTPPRPTPTASTPSSRRRARPTCPTRSK